MSHSGRTIASGQVTHQGYRADVILWGFEARAIIHKLSLHQVGALCEQHIGSRLTAVQVEVTSLSFSPSDQFLLTLGGEDDGSLALWDVESGKVFGQDCQRQLVLIACCVGACWPPNGR